PEPLSTFASASPVTVSKPEKRRSLVPIVLAIAAASIFLCIIGAILFFVLRPTPGEQVTISASETSPQIEPAAAASPPARSTKVKQKAVSQTTRQAKVATTPTSTNDSEESKGESAFDRAGALGLSK